ncbi:hypothetical protein NHX12_021403 [Muraenolepis orangiensis]|uniref:Uncharacterized protein n=1 Tax=Muraenolepis orangiensis TaxID=630683 RepID=A0A9Q0EVE8_9TELE|nr:hypothetical protein NHX12_021403 [Muraenolepis orangiensis]
MQVRMMDRLAHVGDGLVSAVVTKCTRLLKCIRSWLFSNVVDWILKRWPGCVPFPWIRSQSIQKFYSVNGTCLNADNEIVSKLKAKGQIEVKSSAQCDYILAFCPISTRPGIDIQETMAKCPGDKPVILVVLHHTFDPEKNISPQRMDSSHLFSLNKKLLLLNCLFYNHKLLTCDHNCKEIHKVIDHLSSFISKR